MAAARVPVYKPSKMKRAKWRSGRFSGAVTKVQKRNPEEMAERKRLSALLRDAKRKLKKEGEKY